RARLTRLCARLGGVESPERAERRESVMHRFTFRLYYLSLEALKAVKPIVDQIRRFDSNLADQLLRAAQSMHLNIAEGMNSQGKRGNSHYNIALASTDESIAAIDVALAFEYIRNADLALDRLQHVRATLINILRKRRRAKRNAAGSSDRSRGLRSLPLRQHE